MLIELRNLALGSMLVFGVASAAAAEILISDPYVRSSGPTAAVGAAFMRIENTSGNDDRLLEISTAAAARAELHTHSSDSDGVMRMEKIENGIALPAGSTHALERGGDHVMLMGLSAPLVQGETINVTLTFEKAGEISLDIPVDQNR